MGAALRAVAADGEEHVDPLGLQRVGHGLGGLRAAGEPEHRAALLVDVAHGLGVEAHGGHAEAGDDPLEAVAKARDGAHAVLEPELEDHRAHDVVDARAEPAAGDDAGADLGGLEEDPLPRARGGEGEVAGSLVGDEVHVDEHPRVVAGVVGHEVAGAGGELERRQVPRRPEARDAEVILGEAGVVGVGLHAALSRSAAAREFKIRRGGRGESPAPRRRAPAPRPVPRDGAAAHPRCASATPDPRRGSGATPPRRRRATRG